MLSIFLSSPPPADDDDGEMQDAVDSSIRGLRKKISGQSNSTKGRIAAAHRRYIPSTTCRPPPQNQNCPFSWGIWTPINYIVPWAHPSPQPKWHLDQFSRFCRAHDRDRQTDGQRDRQTDSQTTLLRL